MPCKLKDNSSKYYSNFQLFKASRSLHLTLMPPVMLYFNINHCQGELSKQIQELLDKEGKVKKE